MPFDPKIESLLGAQLRLEPFEGFGWVLLRSKASPTPVEIPSELQLELAFILWSNNSAWAAIGKGAFMIGDVRFSTVSLIPRTDDIVSPLDRPIGCNLLFTLDTPSVNPLLHYFDPDYVYSDTFPQARGFGKIANM